MRDVSWNPASSPGTNPPEINVRMVLAAKEDGVHAARDVLCAGSGYGSGDHCRQRFRIAFWCEVPSDGNGTVKQDPGKIVLMHLLVLGAF